MIDGSSLQTLSPIIINNKHNNNMKISAVIVCVVVVWSAVYADDEEEKSLFEKFMEAAQACKDDAGEGLNMTGCFQTFVDGGDLTTPEFKQCTCAGACLSEKLGTMKPDASWDWDKMASINEEMKSFDEDMYNENIKIGEECKDKVGGATDKCDAALKLFDCSMKTSDMVKDKAEMVANSFS